MDIAHIIAEDKIKRAINEGEFNKLPGIGKPLILDDMSSIPENLRMAYKLLKNAGIMEQQENEIRKDLLKIEDLIANCHDEEERQNLKNELNEKLLQFGKVMEKRKHSHSKVFKKYHQQIHDKLSRK